MAFAPRFKWYIVTPHARCKKCTHTDLKPKSKLGKPIPSTMEMLCGVSDQSALCSVLGQASQSTGKTPKQALAGYRPQEMNPGQQAKADLQLKCPGCLRASLLSMEGLQIRAAICRLAPTERWAFVSWAFRDLKTQVPHGFVFESHQLLN